MTVVHSPWCARQVDELSPAYADKVVVIPMGTHRRVTDCDRVTRCGSTLGFLRTPSSSAASASFIPTNC